MANYPKGKRGTLAIVEKEIGTQPKGWYAANMGAALQRQRRWKRFRRHSLMTALSGVGRPLPFAWKKQLASLHPRLGYLLLGDGEFVIDDYLGKFSVQIDVRSATEREMLTGSYEAPLLRGLRRWAKGQSLDIGANVGAVTLALADTVGDGGTVDAVEPGPSFSQRLEKNLQLNPSLSSRVRVHNIGLGAQPGVLNWSEDPWFPGNAWLLGKAGIPVKVATLDSLWEGRTGLDFVKMDVEGMEDEILAGGSQVIQKFRPVMILETSMDFEKILNRPVRQHLVRRLREWGYTLWDLDQTGTVDYPRLPQNTLALPPEALS